MTTLTNIVCKGVLLLAIFNTWATATVNAIDAASTAGAWFWGLSALANVVLAITVVRAEVTWR